MKNTPDSLAFVVLNQEANQFCFVLSTAEEGRPIFALGHRLSWFSGKDPYHQCVSVRVPLHLPHWLEQQQLCYCPVEECSVPLAPVSLEHCLKLPLQRHAWNIYNFSQLWKVAFCIVRNFWQFYVTVDETAVVWLTQNNLEQDMVAICDNLCISAFASLLVHVVTWISEQLL